MTEKSLNDIKIHFSTHSIITSILVFVICLNFYFIVPTLLPMLNEIGKGIPNYVQAYYSVPAYLWPGIGTLFAVLILVKDRIATDKFSFKFDFITGIFVVINFNIFLVGTYLLFIEIIRNIG